MADSFGDTGSSLVAGATYDPDTLTLTVTLRTQAGQVPYTYAGYPAEDWNEFAQAESKGRFFSSRIRPLYVGRKKEK